MSEHRATISWKRKTEDFKYDTYDRTHQLQFGGGQQLQASSAPEYLGNASLVNPEELLVAACSNCHMLTFLAVAAKTGLIVNSYVDEAVGVLGKSEAGRMAIAKVILKPIVEFTTEVSPEKLKGLHEKSHRNCFIANSVSCAIEVQ
jgi:organic hydroperoxide reductase OsmC/OhrA